MDCYGPIPLLAAATTILSAVGAVIAVVCFGIAILLLRQLFFIEDSLVEQHQATHIRITALRETIIHLVRSVGPPAKP